MAETLKALQLRHIVAAQKQQQKNIFIIKKIFTTFTIDLDQLHFWLWQDPVTLRKDAFWI